MPKIPFNIRIDEKLKTDFDRLAKNMGLTTSSLTQLLMRKAVAVQAVPFAVAVDDASAAAGIVTVSSAIDKNYIDEAEAVFDSAKLTIADAIRVFVVKTATGGKMPFSWSAHSDEEREELTRIFRQFDECQREGIANPDFDLKKVAEGGAR